MRRRPRSSRCCAAPGRDGRAHRAQSGHRRLRGPDRGAPPAHPRFHDYPTAATLVAEFDIDRWRDADFGTARAVDFVVPRELE